MKKSSKAKSASKARSKAASAPVKAVKTSKKSAQYSKPAPVVTQRKSSGLETPFWVNLVAVFLILLGYAVYRFWGIATVNGQTISRLAYYQTMEKQIGEQVLDGLITEALILDAAKANNYVVDEAAIDEQLDGIKKQIEANGQTIEEALAAEKMTMPEVRKQFALQQIVQNLGSGSVEVTETEIDDYIAQNEDFLPEGVEGQELRDMVKSQLESQKSNESVNQWIEGLKTGAEIVYR
jgi:hypothetical protein